MPRLRLPRLAVAAGLLAGAATAAQPEATRPVAYLHAAEADGTFDTRDKGLALRPNTETPVFAYVRNPSEDAVKGAVSVTLSRAKDGSQPVAKGTLTGLKGGESRRVLLALVSSPVPPPPPAAGKPAEPAPTPTAAVSDKLYLLTTTEGEDKQPLAAPVQELDVAVNPPANYIEAARQPTFRQRPGGDWEITVTLFGGRKDADGVLKPFAGPPAKVRLDVRPALSPGLDDAAPKQGTYESEVPAGSPGVVLSATGLRFAGSPTGRFAVSIDGYDRALVYDISPSGNDGTPLGVPFALLALPKYHVTGKPLSARVELFQEARDAKPVLDFQRAASGEPQHLTADARSARQVTTAVRAGEGGELRFKAGVSDLVVNVDTAGVYGPRTFTLATTDPTGPARVTQTVTFDETPPSVTLAAIPGPSYVGTKLQVFADVTDAESGVADVLFFVGDPPGPDGKLPPASEGVKGVPATAGGKPAAGRYTATFLLPDAKGRVKVGVRATNGAGLVTTTDSVPVLVTEPKPKRTVGDIKVRVIQGSTPERPQPGLTVELRTAAGAVAQAQTTDDKGEATFKDIQPGAYILYTVKLADLGAKAYAAVSVVADKQADVTLEVKR